MADPILGTPAGGAPIDGGTTPEPADPFEPQQPPLLSEQSPGERPGNTFEERALRQVRGTGPHVTTGGKVARMVGTAGKMNALMHGATGPAATSGEAQRQQLLGAREARQDPYRDSLHYRKDFGTALSDPVHQKVVGQQAQFKKYISDTNKQLANYAQEVTKGRATTEQEYATGQQKIEQSYMEEMAKIPPKSTLNEKYQDWVKNENHTVWVVPGSPNPDTKPEAAYKLQPEQLKPFFEELVANGTPVINNRIYMGNRGQELHDMLRTTMEENKLEYYKAMSPVVAEENRAIDTAKNMLSTQRNQLMSDLQLQYSNTMSQWAAEEGAIQGRKEGLQLEVQSNQQDLAKVRQDYSNRLGRIDQALAAMVGGEAGSRSEAYKPRQISSLMPGAQQQQQSS